MSTGKKFDRVFSPYYDLQELIPSEWEEAADGKSATSDPDWQPTQIDNYIIGNQTN